MKTRRDFIKTVFAGGIIASRKTPVFAQERSMVKIQYNAYRVLKITIDSNKVSM